MIGASRVAAVFASLALVAGCADRPRDPDGTSERIRDSGAVLMGTIQGAAPSPHAEATLARAAAQLGARVTPMPGPGEELLEKLEKGELDIVYGEFAMKSPWAKNVHFGAPLGPRATVGKDERVPRFVFRHGENGWITLVEQAAR